MDRHTRKELKTDKFAEGLGSGFEFLSEHRGQAQRWGLIGLAVLVIAGGVWLYMSHQATARTELLAKAMQVDDATVAAPQPLPLRSVPDGPPRPKCAATHIGQDHSIPRTKAISNKCSSGRGLTKERPATQC